MAEKKLHRGWVKNAAIIFLSVMLLLTFFSGTIMNHSLPEVAVSYAQSGTISGKIRGTGTAVANSAFEVKIDQTRTIATVNVKEGDTVATGDVLMTLSDEESEDLRAAKQTLDEMTLQYRIDQIKANSAYDDDNREIALAQQTLNDAIARRDANSGASNEALIALQEQIKSLKKDLADTGYSGLNEADIRRQENAISDLRDQIANPATDPETGEPIDTEEAERKLKQMKSELRYMEESIELDAQIAEAESRLESMQTLNTAWNEANNEVKAAQKSLDDLLYRLEQNQKIDGNITNLNLQAAKEKIAAQQKIVNELQADSVDAKIVAPMAGIVKSISVAAGDKTGGSDPLLIIEAPDLGYIVSFSVDAEQAKKLSVGDNAEVSGYYGNGIQATLASIRNDQQNPGKSKLLTFSLTGDVDSGTQLTVTVSQKSAEYPTIVPNSAIRTDSTGDFVLTIESKNTPLGNRYIARRADVQVLAKDDTNSAISGSLESWTYVITTSNKPLEPGMQVRLVEQ